MGLYDREYYRDEESFSWRPARTWSGVNLIIGICVVVYVLDILLIRSSPEYRLVNLLANRTDDLLNPLRWFSFVTYAFMHSPLDDPQRLGILHLLFNMFVLWMFGRHVEGQLGKTTFLTLYLTSVVICSLLYSLFFFLLGFPRAGVGASGAVSTVLVYFICANPRLTLYLFGAVPIPAWALGVGILVYDFLGSLAGLMGGGDRVAHEAHLIGAGVGAVYYFFGVPGSAFFQQLQFWWRSRHLRVVREEKNREQALAQEADRVLEKVSRSGYDSLTAKEKKTLETYSRKLRSKQ
jgi:membrane associated rhomboid family serine protease